MVQYYHNAALFVSSTFSIPIATGKSRGKTKANVAIANNQPGCVSTATVTMYGQGTVDTETINPGKVGTYSGVSIDDLSISMSAPATLLVDVRWPDVYPVQDLLVSTDIGVGKPDVVDPRQTRAQNYGDTPMPHGSQSLPLQQDPSGYLLHNQAAVTSNGGGSEKISTVTFSTSTATSTTLTAIYTCPSGIKATVLRILVGPSGSATWTVQTYVPNVSTFTVASASSSTATWTYGPDPGNTVTGQGISLLPGDVLQGATVSSVVGATVEVWQQPL